MSEETKIEVTKTLGAGATSGNRPYAVEINGVLLRNACGVGRRFGTHAAAEDAGRKEIVRRRVQP